MVSYSLFLPTFTRFADFLKLRPQNIACAVKQPKADHPETVKYNLRLYWFGDIRTAITGKRDIGRYVARIIVEPRTQDRYIFIWEEEKTPDEALALAERVIETKLEDPCVDVEELQNGVDTAKGIFPFIFQYMKNLWRRGDSTIENATKEEYRCALDVKELTRTSSRER